MACTGSERVGPEHHRGTVMEHYAGIDVSLERSSVCVVDATGKIVREAKVGSAAGVAARGRRARGARLAEAPERRVGFSGELGLPLARVGLEAGPLSQWLH